jgi:hypothetical protein
VSRTHCLGPSFGPTYEYEVPSMVLVHASDAGWPSWPSMWTFISMSLPDHATSLVPRWASGVPACAVWTPLSPGLAVSRSERDWGRGNLRPRS